MLKGKVDKLKLSKIDNRKTSIIVFSLFFSWLLAFPFEGRILYALANYHNMSAHKFVFGTMVAHFAGLFLCSFFVRTMQRARTFMLFSLVFCFAASGMFFFPPSLIWIVALSVASFLVGGCVAAWGFFLKDSTPKNERFKTIADGLIYSNLLMILLNMTAVYVSPYAGLGLSMLMLCMAFLIALRLPQKEEAEGLPSCRHQDLPLSKNKLITFLYLFIVIITINSGLMYQVQSPAFAHLDWLTSWYWAVPYIVALFIMKNLPRKTSRTYVLYVAIAMIGFSFISFMMLDRSAISYLVVNTLMLGACGVYDLFWWSILGEMLELYKNPSRVLGIGLSANVLGVLLGGLIGNAIAFVNGQSVNPTLLALGVVCVTIVMLPPLHKQLTVLLKDHAYLTVISEMPPQEQTRLIRELTISEKLTERENEIASLLLTGKTYRMIAGELHVSENTVKTHVKNIYSKVGVQSRTELMNILLDIQTSALGSPKPL